MKRHKQLRAMSRGLFVLLCTLLLISFQPTRADERLKTVDVADHYFGTKVPDPYRWLEDADSPETRAFVDQQNARVRAFVDGPVRERLKSRLTELQNYPKLSAPRRDGQRYFFTKNDGLQNQAVLYVRESLDGEPRVLIDPNTLRKDGTMALSGTHITHDGELMAYGLAEGGSDQKTIHVRRINDGKDLPDVLEWCKFSSVAWTRDKSGFWYNRYPTPGSVPKEDQARHNKLYFHKLGGEQSDDPQVYDPQDKELSVSPFTSEDDQYLLLDVNRGSSNKNRFYYSKLDNSQKLDVVKLFDKEDAEYDYIEHDGPIFYIRTNLDAPRRRLIAIDTTDPGNENWKEIIPQAQDMISEVRMINDQFVVSYLHDAHEIVKIFNRDGSFDRDIPLPEIGGVGITGKRKDKLMFVTFTSFTYPSTILKYDFASKDLAVYNKPDVKFDPQQYQTKEVFSTSKDGTKVPLFIVARSGLKLDGNNPTLLTGYGGFNISETPSFSASRIAWLEQGGVFALACMRGGGEYGEEWHKAGMLDRKQNVFDDFFAAAQWLIDNGYTSNKKLAIEGRSNGGLLVATSITQRPDLFGAAICGVPLTDMLRYHRFSVGRFWIPEYGSAQNSEEQFKTLYAYSPLHHVKPGTVYPPTLITTAEGDDRVVPLHARKFAATLLSQGSGGPILLRTETRAGHGGGKPITKAIEESADGYAFLVKVLGMETKSAKAE